MVTHIGLKTFIDPRVEGGKLNARTTEELIEVVTLAGREGSSTAPSPSTFASSAAPTADEKGNITLGQGAGVPGSPAHGHGDPEFGRHRHRRR